MKRLKLPTWLLGLLLIMARVPDGSARNKPNCTVTSASEAVPTATAPTAESCRVLSATNVPSPVPASAADTASGNAASPHSRIPSHVRLSPYAIEIVKLAQAGIECGVMLAFIENSGTFNLDADQVVYLRDVGVPGEVITAMLQHDAELAKGLRPLTVTFAPASQGAFWTTVTPSNYVPAISSAPLQTPILSQAGGDDALVRRTGGDAVRGKKAVDDLEPSRPTYTTTSGPGASTYQAPSTSQAPGQTTRPRPRESVVYSVREPYPVELTAPIVFVPGAGRTANVIIIELFP